MRKRQNKYSPRHLVYSILMMLLLAWLTISAPFVYASYNSVSAVERQQCEQPSDEDCNPFSNTTEEKSHNGLNTLSEYLHDIYHADHHSSIIDRCHKGHTYDLYFAFHPELISPPPELS